MYCTQQWYLFIVSAAYQMMAAEWCSAVTASSGTDLLRICAPKYVHYEIKLKLYPFRKFLPSKYVPLLKICKMKFIATPKYTPSGN